MLLLLHERDLTFNKHHEGRKTTAILMPEPLGRIGDLKAHELVNVCVMSLKAYMHLITYFR